MGEKLKRYELLINHETVPGFTATGLSLNENGPWAKADEAERVIGELEANIKQHRIDRYLSVSERCAKYQEQACHICERASCGDNTNPMIKEINSLREQVAALEADRKLLRSLIATMRRGEDETMEDAIEGIEALRGEVDGLKSRLAAVGKVYPFIQTKVEAGPHSKVWDSIREMQKALSPSFACPGCEKIQGELRGQREWQHKQDHLRSVIQEQRDTLNRQLERIPNALDSIDICVAGWDCGEDIMTFNGKPIGSTLPKGIRPQDWWGSLREELKSYLASALAEALKPTSMLDCADAAIAELKEEIAAKDRRLARAREAWESLKGMSEQFYGDPFEFSPYRDWLEEAQNIGGTSGMCEYPDDPVPELDAALATKEEADESNR